MDREAWQATVHEVSKESDTTQQIINNISKFKQNGLKSFFFSGRPSDGVLMRIKSTLDNAVLFFFLVY